METYTREECLADPVLKKIVAYILKNHTPGKYLMEEPLMHETPDIATVSEHYVIIEGRDNDNAVIHFHISYTTENWIVEKQLKVGFRQLTIYEDAVEYHTVRTRKMGDADVKEDPLSN